MGGGVFVLVFWGSDMLLVCLSPTLVLVQTHLQNTGVRLGISSSAFTVGTVLLTEVPPSRSNEGKIVSASFLVPRKESFCPPAFQEALTE